MYIGRKLYKQMFITHFERNYAQRKGAKEPQLHKSKSIDKIEKN